MEREVPAVRIWPMSDRIQGFVGKGIDEVQRELFLRDLPRNGGKYRYQSSGLNAAAGTVVLFQYRARVIASAVFVADEKYEKPRRGCAGELRVDPQSIRVFEPVDAGGMRAVWPGFRAFGHVKQRLNPWRYEAFEEVLRGVKTPGRRRG